MPGHAHGFVRVESFDGGDDLGCDGFAVVVVAGRDADSEFCASYLR